jgi:hypothetical protein
MSAPSFRTILHTAQAWQPDGCQGGMPVGHGGLPALATPAARDVRGNGRKAILEVR